MAKRKVRPAVIDFEGFGIQKRPSYPPAPTGVSIIMPTKSGKPVVKYYSWGHASENNCTWADARKALKAACACDDVVFHNAKFDIDVLNVHFDLDVTGRVHDTMILAFLVNPHATKLGLKELAEEHLGQPPEERDAVCEWLVKNQPVPGVKISKSRNSEFYYAKFLPWAPGSLVGEYANGDTIRTLGLFDLFYDAVSKTMARAYDREMKLMRHLLTIERQGVPVDLPRLRSDVAMYRSTLEKIDAWVFKRLKSEPFNIMSGDELLAAMSSAGVLDEDKLQITASGKYSKSKDSLSGAINDSQLYAMLAYRSQLHTCLGTFMENWLAMAERSGGFIFTNWNQVKGERGGTRSGRLSSTPNFQNAPNEFKPLFKDEVRKDKSKYPSKPFKLPPLPIVRSYIIAHKGHVLLDRDYSQQEPRILAHFDGGALMDQYNSDPWTDVHDYAKAELEKVGLFYERKPVKNTNLGLIYGMGTAKLAEDNGMSYQEAKILKEALMELYPGLREMYKEMRRRAKAEEPITTWGGRVYYCEPERYSEKYGRVMSFDYKLVNLLIQGSGADCTKEAIINFMEDPSRKPDWYLMLNVHDQLVVSAPKRDKVTAMSLLKDAMERVEFDVPMLTEGAISDTNWGEMKDYDKKGDLVHG